MLCAINDITTSSEIQAPWEVFVEKNEETKKVTVTYISKRATGSVQCPSCGGSVEIHDDYEAEFKDFPIDPDYRQTINLKYHRYKCKTCRKKFTEDISTIKYPRARLSHRSALWIKKLLTAGLPISSLVKLSGIHWATVKKIYEDVMDEALNKREKYVSETGYKPRYLAVDEFAIHKGHKYATCVMDLDNGEIIWAGIGRSKEEFKAFFKDTDIEYLSKVKAVAMDMNASYNILFKEYLPQAQIVYDRYHMQAQFGRDVLGVVRLDAAREHKKKANELKLELSTTEDEDKRAELNKQIKEENIEYRKVKKGRWPVLRNQDNLTEKQSEVLKDILDRHLDLAVCYALKEEMIELFKLTDPKQAKEGWEKWFKACAESGIPALIKFATNKEKNRMDGLVAHATYHISTGKLEGMNNKIKVAKRIAYGYRDEEYFFKLIKYKSLSDLII